MTPEALDRIRSRHREYSRKSRIFWWIGFLCSLTLLVGSAINIYARGTPWQHSVRWMLPVAFLVYGVEAAFQLLSRGRRYKRAADVLAGAVVRVEVNPALPEEYWTGIEARVEQALHAPLTYRARRKTAAA